MSVPSSSAALLLLALTGVRAASAAAPPPTPGVDCACSTVGAYVLPIAPVPALPANGITGNSPGGRFSVAAVPGTVQAAAITVTRNLDGAVLLNHLEAADWGFSPDDDRLVVATKAVNGSPATVTLHDLTTVPASKLREITPAAAGSAVSFSPHGRWFVNVELSPSPSNVTAIPSLTSFMPVTLVFSQTASVMRSMLFARMFTKSRSAPGSSPAVISTTVTLLPRAA
jgi:hypothetical protein